MSVNAWEPKRPSFMEEEARFLPCFLTASEADARYCSDPDGELRMMDLRNGALHSAPLFSEARLATYGHCPRQASKIRVSARLASTMVRWPALSGHVSQWQIACCETYLFEAARSRRFHTASGSQSGCSLTIAAPCSLAAGRGRRILSQEVPEQPLLQTEPFKER